MFLLAACVVALLANAAVSRVLGSPTGRATSGRADTSSIPDQPSDLPAPPTDGPVVLLIGNSHTYALPGVRQGEDIRTGEPGTLLDELATRVTADSRRTPPRFYRLAYPNFLPLEILIRVGQMLRAGWRPAIVVFAWSWSNVARGRSVRSDVRDALRDESLTDDLVARLSRPEVAAAPGVLSALRTEQAELDRLLAEEHERSTADRWETEVQDVARDEIALLGRSADIRAKFYRDVVMSIQSLRFRRPQGEYMYDAVDLDMDFNRLCIVALMRLMASEGVFVFSYASPERPDGPALVNPAREPEAFGEFEQVTADLDFATIDARGLIVDPAVWGWAGLYPDRSHFTEPGHQTLAQYLFDEGQARGLWARLQPGEPR